MDIRYSGSSWSWVGQLLRSWFKVICQRSRMENAAVGNASTFLIWFDCNDLCVTIVASCCCKCLRLTATITNFLVLLTCLIVTMLFAAEYNGWFTAPSARKSARLHRCVPRPCARNRLEKCPLEHLRRRHWRYLGRYTTTNLQDALTLGGAYDGGEMSTVCCSER